ncbi:MAG: VacB/RNase II family 3'-5' exoribonuclease, partial [Phycisphaerae bacterium]|nr:VacB/RNase II family 3'-5' exoribonuclease [Phycisphaerae bacterium]
WRRAVMKYISTHPARPLKPKPLSHAIGVTDRDYGEFRQLVRDMLDGGEIALGPGRVLIAPKHSTTPTGLFHGNEHGYGFVEIAGGPDLYIPRGRVNGALDGDTVAVRLIRSRSGSPPERQRAEVTRIICRAPEPWVGVLECSGRDWLVQPMGKRGAPLVRVEDAHAHGARAGDLVVVEADEDTLEDRTVRGRIVERLGPADSTDAIITGVIRRSGLAESFPADVEAEAAAAAESFDPERVADREDLRELLTITIDPADARDFDDAISVEDLPGGNVRLGVHIADVAHFVPVGGRLDEEACRRGTSVYFPRRVVPMLPPTLSNGVCSLQPRVVRLTRSVFITYDRHGHVRKTRCCKSIICSTARLTYEQATQALGGAEAGVEPDVLKLLKHAEHLARRIQARRIADGMIVLNLPEVEIRLDAGGRVVDSGAADTSFSHTIIEMFMVEANEAVSRTLTEAGVPSLRRVHPPPDPDAVRNLRPLRALLGKAVPRVLDRASIKRLLDAVAGQPEAPAVHYVLLRSMAHAAYGTGDEGHFALASDDYCHFTSPIRRYPDLAVHRALAALLETKSARRRKSNTDAASSAEVEMMELGQQQTAAERRAEQAERDARRALLLQLMSTKIGETMEGLVTAVTPRGVFVQLQPTLAEGFVDVNDFGADVWEHDQRASVFVGVQTRRMVFVGLRVNVVVTAVDTIRERLELVPANDAFGHDLLTGR